MAAVGDLFANNFVSLFLAAVIALFLGTEHGRKLRFWLRRNAHKARVDIVGKCLVLIAVAVTTGLNFSYYFLYSPYPNYLLVPAAICVGYVIYSLWAMFSARSNVNILAWIGWDILDHHVRSRQIWKRVKYRAIYYNRGISASTELYDAHRNPFHVIVLDAERLAAINAESPDNIAVLPSDIGSCYNRAALVDRILALNDEWLRRELLEFGVPVRFGFNEVLYSADMTAYLVGKGNERCLSQIRLRELNEKIKKNGQRLRICMWDWYLPTLSTLLCAYLTTDNAPFYLKDVYVADKDSVNRVAQEIREDIKLLKGQITLLREAKDLEEFLSNKDDNSLDLVVGFGSIAVSVSGSSLRAFIPREGLLAWIEFASLLKTEKDNKSAQKTITDLILSLDTQTHLLTSAAPIGLPATEEAFESCKYGQQLIMKTAKELCGNEKIPLVLRRLPSGPDPADPGAGSLRDTWESAWDSMRQIIEDR